ncbi:MAG: twin-arginine translocation signal domain-containing protein [Anaerolineae bacterium]|nr:twin-arginine translocation signal domain-containing protein [Anaerolineae bacterium]
MQRSIEKEQKTMSSQREISRRDFLKLGSAAGGAF